MFVGLSQGAVDKLVLLPTGEYKNAGIPSLILDRGQYRTTKGVQGLVHLSGTDAQTYDV